LTVRHLLTHTSGLGYSFTSPVVRDFKPRSGDHFPAGPLLFEPGEQWLYGTSTDWVGRLVESVSGQSLEVYFRGHIFGPLGMTDTSYSVPGDRRPRLVTVHRRQPGGTFEVHPIQPSAVVTEFSGGGGLASTAADYTRFLQMFLHGGTFNGARVLSADTIGSMGQNHIGTIGVPASRTALPEMSNDFSFIADGRDKWGLGFLITADHHGGKRSSGSLSWGGINNTYFWVDPSRGVAGVILMQYRPFADGKALALYDAFERAVYQLTPAAK
jgi:CubicO group peptidase (beta-lactamase class C family)